MTVEPRMNANLHECLRRFIQTRLGSHCAPVAQISNLLYRSASSLRGSQQSSACQNSERPADWKSAIQQVWKPALRRHALIVALSLLTAGCQHEQTSRSTPSPSGTEAGKTSTQRDEAASRAAFLTAYSVFMHPRCMNCHPSSDVPLQGEDSHPHLQNVKRGPDGRGLYALKCKNCHQDKNLPGEGMPPGHPQWHLPPANMRMVFQGKSPAELARQLKDPKQNGGKTLEEIIRHVAGDSLVLTGWNPAEGRSKPPLSHAEFAAKMGEWIEKGAAIPE